MCSEALLFSTEVPLHCTDNLCIGNALKLAINPKPGQVTILTDQVFHCSYTYQRTSRSLKAISEDPVQTAEMHTGQNSLFT